MTAEPVRWRGPNGKTRFVIIRRSDLDEAFPKFARHRAFIKKLQEQDDFVVWWTAFESGTPNGFLPSLDMLATSSEVTGIMRVCEKRWPEITEGVVVGDTTDLIRAVQSHNKESAFPWAFLLTKKFRTLVKKA